MTSRSTVPVPRRPRRPAGRPPDEALTPAILRAALQELARVGFEAISIEQVARRAGAAKTSIYRRWPTKDALVVEALRFYLRDVAGAESAAQADTGSLRGDLLAHALRLARLLTRERIAVLAGLLLAIRTRPELGALVRAELVQTEMAAATAIVERATARGENVADRLPSLARQVLPSVLFTRSFVVGAPVSDAFVTELVDDVLLPLFQSSRARATGKRRASRKAVHQRGGS